MRARPIPKGFLSLVDTIDLEVWKPSRPKVHTHKWTEWAMRVNNKGPWVDKVTEHSPGGFWIERYWVRFCVRGEVKKHAETWAPNLIEENKYSKYPLPTDTLDPSNNRRVFIQASGSGAWRG